MILTPEDIAYADTIALTVEAINPADLKYILQRGPETPSKKILQGSVRTRQLWVIHRVFHPRWREVWDRYIRLLVQNLWSRHGHWTVADWMQWGHSAVTDLNTPATAIYWYFLHLPLSSLANDAAAQWLVERGEQWERDVRDAMMRLQMIWPETLRLADDMEPLPSEVVQWGPTVEKELQQLRQRIRELEQALDDQARWYESWFSTPDVLAGASAAQDDEGLAGMTWAVVGPSAEREGSYRQWAQRCGVTLWFWPGHQLWPGGTLPQVDAIGVVTTSIKHGVWERFDRLWSESIPRIYVPFNGIALWDREVRAWMARQRQRQRDPALAK
ncbi:hypothetical protein TPY_2727 [Sulfobacillus acidophilus TPY]|uniref:Uncharacterized protein n=1 Tax=Sulfobacillus acidophilus (strain ATCC 700253 / DSM 10332 / NAL) TaxID=679936 RepID=G8TUK7_SULAD|nr:hypothetical protein TPY_2727 [Sulfobacillus acidophilus TPY]AEW04654.1 hypothetical protein Sulac_1154 [Sulfobacillus acidophilus DSM 10332]